MRQRNERLEKWRKLLSPAKPEGWKWQPPEPVKHIEAKEPPESVKGRLDKLMLELPETEREVLNLRFVVGLTAKEVGWILGGNEILATIIERGAVERLAKSLGVDEQTVFSWVAWWGSEKAKSFEGLAAVRKPKSQECLSLERIYVALLRWDWTEKERLHIRSCNYCRATTDRVKKRIWHPDAMQLWKFTVAEVLSEEDERIDIRYHLETDRCKRCEFIVEKVFKPIAEVRFLLGEGVQFHRVSGRLFREDFLSLVFTDREEVRFRYPVAVVSPAPVALSVEGFASEAQDEVSVKEEVFRAQLRKEDRGWVARAEAFKIPEGSKVLFVWFTPDGTEKIRREAEFKLAFRDWLYAEAVMASGEERLGEGYFAAILLPPLA